MSYKNIHGRLGKGKFHDPVTGEEYRSLYAYRQARHKAREERLRETIQLTEEADKERNAHFQAWIDQCCITEVRAGGIPLDIEADIRNLRASYVQWCNSANQPERTAQAWGRWMGERFPRVNRNAQGVGRVYCGITLKPKENPNGNQ